MSTISKGGLVPPPLETLVWEASHLPGAARPSPLVHRGAEQLLCVDPWCSLGRPVDPFVE